MNRHTGNDAIRASSGLGGKDRKSKSGGASGARGRMCPSDAWSRKITLGFAYATELSEQRFRQCVTHAPHRRLAGRSVPRRRKGKRLRLRCRRPGVRCGEPRDGLCGRGWQSRCRLCLDATSRIADTAAGDRLCFGCRTTASPIPASGYASSMSKYAGDVQRNVAEHRCGGVGLCERNRPQPLRTVRPRSPTMRAIWDASMADQDRCPGSPAW